MKTKEELTALKEEVEALNKKHAELNDDELKEVAGGFGFGSELKPGDWCKGKVFEYVADPSSELARCETALKVASASGLTVELTGYVCVIDRKSGEVLNISRFSASASSLNLTLAAPPWWADQIKE